MGRTRGALKKLAWSIPGSGLAYRAMRSRVRRDLPTRIAGSREILETLSPRPRATLPVCSFAHPNPVLDLSVVVPVHDVERWLGACLDSIRSQRTSASLEIVVVNDGSTDGSLGIIESRMRRDDRIVLIDQENRGVSAARNAGIDASRGRALAFVDSDDILAPGHLENLLAVFRLGRCDYVSGNYSRITERGWNLGPPGRIRMHGGPGGRIYKREVWSDIRFPEQAWFEDTVHAYCIKTRYVEALSNDVGYLYRARRGSITGSSRADYKSIDTYWVVEEMLDWCRRLGIPLTQELYDQTLRQCGALMLYRTACLDEEERKALFSSSCDLIEGVEEFRGLTTAMPGRWKDVESALRSRRYRLWKLACGMV